MSAPTPEYELVLMLDPEVPDERRDQIAADARQRIETAGGLKSDNAWGMRKLAYEINQRTEADYRFFRFETGGSLLDDLTHNLKIADGVLRFRIFKVDPRLPVIVPPPPTPLASSAPRGPRRGDDRGRGGPSRGRRRDEEEPVAAPAAEAPAATAVAEAEAPAEAAPEAPAEAAAPEAPVEAAPEVPPEAAPEAPAEAAPEGDAGAADAAPGESA
jgi:small subunit ribosomal protein S6